MTDTLKPLDEETGRATKQFLAEQMAEVTRQAGAMPLTRHIEDVAEQVVRKVAVNREDEIRKAALPQSAPEAEAKPGALPTSRRPDGLVIPASWDEQKAKDWALELGAVEAEVTIDRHTGEVLSVKRHTEPAPAGPSLPPEWQARRKRLRYLAQKPEWRQKIEAVLNAANGNKAILESKMEELYQDSIRYFGDPLKPFEPRIVSLPSAAMTQRILSDSQPRPGKLLGKR